ncbi:MULTISPECIES: hypothetical protein [Alteromonadaceae]|uniref:hypothetical protein n=1 Tax=Alteromonadaceae TaxID=72275 RepID=UPI001C0916C5|nr:MULTISPECIES: hypothetical protein [Aliiglaciecola]MBU2878694.1 hypothetical protein [Aliiglaciecola lipolytica]MDO6709477.1 hypothetical protein [Aliiglaciecola sp. 2_MG-2023]MDO6750981.1 hypothetical protein [Aliiglaciecola sp. 1_MG-2023]
MSAQSNSTLRPLFEKLTENMQLIYRKSIDADEALSKLQQSGKGKFNHIFAEDAGFAVQSKRFMPYVKELAAEVASLETADQAQFESSLPEIVKKMELLLSTLSQLKTTL